MFDVALSVVAASYPAERLRRIGEGLPRELIVDALQPFDSASFRKRRLPPERVLTLVIAMAFDRDRSIADVVDHLDLAFGKGPIAPGSIPPARLRLGAAPVEWLFKTTAASWGHASADRNRWKGLALYALDGTTFSVADTVENEQHFGRGKGTAPAAYPSLRCVTLMAVRSRTLADAVFAGVNEASEQALAARLWDTIPAQSLVLIDRGLASANVVHRIASLGNHWITRAKKNASWTVIEEIGKGDRIVEFQIPAKTIAAHPDLDLPKRYRARAISYRVGDAADSVLLTSLLDAKRFSAKELVGVYHERWEIELGFRELKAELKDASETLRSRLPALVEQEMWGLLLAYNLIRTEIENIARTLRVEPLRISFIGALRFIRTELVSRTWGAPGRVGRYLDDIHECARTLLLGPRRIRKASPRALKGWPKYPQKRSRSRVPA